MRQTIENIAHFWGRCRQSYKLGSIAHERVQQVGGDALAAETGVATETEEPVRRRRE